MTCNPERPEIFRKLFHNQNDEDRHDICARVFHMKLQEMMHSIQIKEIFGKVVAYFRVIEFQKMGLPHAHYIQSKA